MDFPFLAAILAWLGSAAAWVTGYLAAKFGYKVAVIAAVFAIYAAIWAALLGLLTGLWSLMPSGYPADALAFFPDPSVTASAVSIYLGTLITLRSLEFWRSFLGTSSIIAGQ
ncbi:MAG: hypothetical protein ACYCSN_18325 [Acidobacteriaceae bacterium]